MKFCLIIIFLSLFPFLFACEPSINLPAKFAEVQKNGYYQHRYVHIEPAFSSTQKTLIIQSFDIWTKKTNGYLRWTITNWPENWWDGDIREPEELTGLCSNHLLVFKNVSDDQVIIDIETDVNHSISGFARRALTPCGNESISLVEDKLNTPIEFKQVMLHEIGHILQMDHDNKGQIAHNEQSIMSYSWMFYLNEPTDYDLIWLLKINNFYNIKK